MPDVMVAGIVSSWTIAWNTCKSHLCRTDPPNFSCSGERLSGLPAFPLFSRFKACTISSGVSGSSKTRLLLLKVSVRCNLHFSSNSASFGLFCLSEVPRSWKCWAQTGRVSSSLWMNLPSTKSLHLSCLLWLGHWKRLLRFSLNHKSLSSSFLRFSWALQWFSREAMAVLSLFPSSVHTDHLELVFLPLPINTMLSYTSVITYGLVCHRHRGIFVLVVWILVRFSGLLLATAGRHYQCLFPIHLCFHSPCQEVWRWRQRLLFHTLEVTHIWPCTSSHNGCWWSSRIDEGCSNVWIGRWSDVFNSCSSTMHVVSMFLAVWFRML